jgi:hypothetical protein
MLAKALIELSLISFSVVYIINDDMNRIIEKSFGVFNASLASMNINLA